MGANVQTLKDHAKNVMRRRNTYLDAIRYTHYNMTVLNERCAENSANNQKLIEAGGSRTYMSSPAKSTFDPDTSCKDETYRGGRIWSSARADVVERIHLR